MSSLAQTLRAITISTNVALYGIAPNQPLHLAGPA
jgi:hypothetical protein